MDIVIDFSEGIIADGTGVLGEAELDGETVTVTIKGVLVQDWARVEDGAVKESTTIRVGRPPRPWPPAGRR